MITIEYVRQQLLLLRRDLKIDVTFRNTKGIPVCHISTTGVPRVGDMEEMDGNIYQVIEVRWETIKGVRRANVYLK